MSLIIVMFLGNVWRLAVSVQSICVLHLLRGESVSTNDAHTLDHFFPTVLGNVLQLGNVILGVRGVRARRGRRARGVCRSVGFPHRIRSHGKTGLWPTTFPIF